MMIKKTYKYTLCIVSFLTIFLCGASTVFAQSKGNTDEALARQYFLNNKYDKAAYYYDKLYRSSAGDDYYYSYLLQCYIQLQQYKTAEKLAEKQQKKFPDRPNYTVDMGYIYQVQGNQKKADKYFKQAIKDLPPNRQVIISVADAFEKIQDYDDALAVYNKAQKLLGYDNFNMQRARIYSLKGDYASMIDEYLDLLNLSPAYIQSVQNALQISLHPDLDGKKKAILRQELLKRVQKHPDKTVYAELLIWYYIQDKNFQGAFIRAKALDRRNKEDGLRIFTLAKIALKNNDYNTAIDCYDYIINMKPKENYYYDKAKMQKVDALFTKIETIGKYTDKDLQDLKAAFTKTLSALGEKGSTAPLLREEARFYAFYLHNTNQAEQILQKAIHLGDIEKHEQAKCKIQLADIYVLEGNVWNAALLYGQVESDFKYDELGDEAKFKNAKISYYTGNFKWAKAQLDVLKASTSKLIANDAMDLSLLITDNTTLDTNTVPLKMYAQADLLTYQRKFNAAMNKLDSIDSLFPHHSLADEILLEKGKIMEKEQNFTQAAKYLEQLVQQYPKQIWADNALFMLGELYEYHIQDKKKAMHYYKQIMLNYASSIFVTPARRHYRILRGDDVYQKEDKQLEN